MAHRRHAVLAPVSRGYPPPNDKSLRVTHPSATDSRNCPCDLHVLSMPPAFALSQDQTLRFIGTKPRRIQPKQTKPKTTRNPNHTQTGIQPNRLEPVQPNYPSRYISIHPHSRTKPSPIPTSQPASPRHGPQLRSIPGQKAPEQPNPNQPSANTASQPNQTQSGAHGQPACADPTKRTPPTYPFHSRFYCPPTEPAGTAIPVPTKPRTNRAREKNTTDTHRIASTAKAPPVKGEIGPSPTHVNHPTHTIPQGES